MSLLGDVLRDGVLEMPGFQPKNLEQRLLDELRTHIGEQAPIETRVAFIDVMKAHVGSDIQWSGSTTKTISADPQGKVHIGSTGEEDKPTGYLVFTLHDTNPREDLRFKLWISTNKRLCLHVEHIHDNRNPSETNLLYKTARDKLGEVIDTGALGKSLMVALSPNKGGWIELPLKEEDGTADNCKNGCAGKDRPMLKQQYLQHLEKKR